MGGGMSNRDDHLRLLQQAEFPVPANVPGLSPAERQLLAKCGFWLQALAEGELTPEGAARARFVAVAGGREAPHSDYERAWVILQAASRPRKAVRPVTPAGDLSPEGESVLR